MHSVHPKHETVPLKSTTKIWKNLRKCINYLMREQKAIDLNLSEGKNPVNLPFPVNWGACNEWSHFRFAIYWSK